MNERLIPVDQIAKIVLDEVNDTLTPIQILAAAIYNLETAIQKPVVRQAIIDRLPKKEDTNELDVSFEDLLRSVDHHAARTPFTAAKRDDEEDKSTPSLADIVQITTLAALWEARQ